MPRYTRRAIIVIPASEKNAANEWWKDTIDPTGTEAFVSVLKGGLLNSQTFYWCSTVCTEDQWQRIYDHFPTIYDGRTITPEEVLTTEGKIVQSSE